jgi:cytochrome c biogenesis protein ResB
MLWWFLILAVSTGVVVSVAISLVMRVWRQMKQATPHPHEPETLDQHPSSPEKQGL